MKLYSTRNMNHIVDLKEAVMRGLPPDNGLYMPLNFPKLPDDFIKNIKNYTFQEISFEVCKTLFGDYIPESDLKEIVYNAIQFPAPVVPLDDEFSVLELFHGPSLAFKDFGARFMAQLMSYFNRGNEKELVILVATSGDTGGAVASGFLDVPGIKVVILYPNGGVSELQECQLTTLGSNISAIRVDGTFDDCQAMVKRAFLDKDLNESVRLTSANSINIARLIPQSFYYFEAYKQLPNDGKKNTFIVPSGNFGNLTAGFFAKLMGLPIDNFVAATNVNDVVPEYIETGEYKPRKSVRTLSNAMDVGNPSNFARLLYLFDPMFSDGDSSTWNIFKENLQGFSVSDTDTEDGVREVSQRFNYCIDPHGAVGYVAGKRIEDDSRKVVFETAHPSKFLSDMERILDSKVEVPQRLLVLKDKKKDFDSMGADSELLRSYLLSKFS